MTPSNSFLEPNTTSDPLMDREEWLEEASKNFVKPDSANAAIYRVILETLWPENHGIPGPIISPTQIREAVDKFKGKPYGDVFRRLRELQGEEGFKCIIKRGNSYQLINLNVSEKKAPRIKLPPKDWKKVLEKYHGVCANCGKHQNTYAQDHKVPRDRNGSNALYNWQPLCTTCNSIKSAACKGCKEECSTCGWAYPEYYRPLKIPGDTLKELYDYAKKKNEDANVLVNRWIQEKIKHSD